MLSYIKKAAKCSNPLGDLRKDIKMENNGQKEFEMLNDEELNDVSGGLSAEKKEKVDKCLDVLDKVLDFVDPNSAVGKASVNGAKSVIKAIKKN